MTSLACSVALQQLQAFHDDELPVQEQIAMSSHLDGCGRCRETLSELEGIGDWLRASAPGRASMSCDEAAGFQSAVVNRARVEDAESLVSWARALFDDRRVLYSVFGAAGATLACLVVMLTMMRFAGIERTDSLAGMMNMLKEPSGSEPVVIRPTPIDARFMMARTVAYYNESDGGDVYYGVDSVLALSGVVTSEGRVSNIEVNDGNGGLAMAGMDKKRLGGLVDAVSRTRFEPMTKEGEPISVNMVWFVAQTTVRGSNRRPLAGPAPIGARRRVV